MTMLKAEYYFACFSGYSGLTVDSTGSNLMCNCTDDNIYMFNISGLKTTPGNLKSRPTAYAAPLPKIMKFLTFFFSTTAYQ